MPGAPAKGCTQYSGMSQYPARLSGTGRQIRPVSTVMMSTLQNPSWQRMSSSRGFVGSCGTHTVLFGATTSGGQAVEAPLQLSAGSQTEYSAILEGRHTVPDDLNPSAGQSRLTPSQVSATS